MLLYILLFDVMLVFCWAAWLRMESHQHKEPISWQHPGSDSLTCDEE